MRLTMVGLAFASALGSASAAALPADSGTVNVRDFGAKGNGEADDTQAIRAAISAAHVDQGKGFWPSRSVYFPAGTYRVTDTLYNRDAAGRFDSSMSLIGESIEKVRIKLADKTEGFGQSDQPKPVIFTSSKLIGGSPTAGGKNYLEKGEGNDAYGNYIEDITVDVGRGNPGAVAIDFLASNVGAIRRVAIVAPAESGRIGISMERKWPGPLLLSGVRIDGFAIGIAIAQPEYSVTMENLQLSGQTEVGIRNNGNSISMQNVSIKSAALAVQNIGAAGLIVADRLTIASTGTASWVENRGYITMKNVSVASRDSGKPAGGLAGGESGAYFANDRLTGFDAGWVIASESPPAAVAPPLSRWANVVKFGAKPGTIEDSSPAISAAFRSGAEVVYFPSGRYLISQSIDIPASVRRIVGMNSSLVVLKKRDPDFSPDTGMLRIATDGEPLVIEGVALDNDNRGRQLGVQHVGSRTLVLRDFIFTGTGIFRKSTGGPFFLENICCGSMRVSGPAGVWVRQLNSEGTSTRVVNDGSPMSILGIKVEQNCTVLENLKGANTEVLGGLIYQVKPVGQQKPAFINNEGGRLVVSYTEEAYVPNSSYQEHVVQIGAEQQRQAVTADQLPPRGKLARIMPGLSFSGIAPDGSKNPDTGKAPP